MTVLTPAVPLEVEERRSSGGSVLGFFALTFLVTWAFFIAAVLKSRGLAPGALPGPVIQALVLLGAITPSLVALGLTLRREGGAGVHALLGRIARWRVAPRWYAFAIGFMAAAKLAAAAVHRLATGAWPAFAFEGWVLMLAALLISTWAQAGEEIGWRGFALPRLAARFGLGPASLVLGVIWALWHLPLFYLHGADTFGQSFVVYTLQVTAISVAMAWLYWKTGGSLLLVMLMHAAINNTKGIVPAIPRPAANPFVFADTAAIAWASAAVLGAIAAYLLFRMRGAALTRP